MSEKYNINFPEIEYEENLPDQIKIKIMEDYFESQEIKNLIEKTENNNNNN